MNCLTHTTGSEYSIMEIQTKEYDGYSQLYVWECRANGFSYNAWISYEGDHTLAKSSMEIAYALHLRGIK